MAVSRLRTRLAALASSMLLAACTSQLELDVISAVRDAANDESGQGRGADAGGAGGEREGSVDPELAECAALGTRELSIEAGEPSLLLVVNRSTSMLEELGERTKLESVARSVMRVLAGRRLPVGLVQFPGPSPFCSNQVACCASPVITAPRADGGRSVDALLRCELQSPACFETNDSAPVAAALRQVLTFFNVVNAGQSRSAVLVTDEDPHCGQLSSMGEACEDAVLQAAALAQQKIPTYVVPIGNDGAACLRRLAQAGQTHAQGDPWPSVRTETDVEQTLERAVATIEEGFCRARLRFPAQRPQAVRLFLEGREVPRGDANGPSAWAFEDGSATRIQFFGEACVALKRRFEDVRAFEVCCRGLGRECR